MDDRITRSGPERDFALFGQLAVNGAVNVPLDRRVFNLVARHLDILATSQNKGRLVPGGIVVVVGHAVTGETQAVGGDSKDQRNIERIEGIIFDADVAMVAGRLSFQTGDGGIDGDERFGKLEA